MSQNMRSLLCMLMAVLGAAATFRELQAQDHARFLKVKKWKISYTLEIIRASAYPPEDMEGWNTKLADDTYSLLVEKSRLKATLIFDKKEDRTTWIGSGDIEYDIHALSRGAISGSSMSGKIKGKGTTTLCIDESWFSVDPTSGTYDLFLMPGDGDQSGMTVMVSGENSVWEDIIEKLQASFGEATETILTSHLGELDVKEYPAEPDDAFYCTDPERWMVDVEYASLPEEGLVIHGDRLSHAGSHIAWTIEPLE